MPPLPEPRPDHNISSTLHTTLTLIIRHCFYHRRLFLDQSPRHRRYSNPSLTLMSLPYFNYTRFTHHHCLTALYQTLTQTLFHLLEYSRYTPPLPKPRPYPEFHLHSLHRLQPHHEMSYNHPPPSLHQIKSHHRRCNHQIFFTTLTITLTLTIFHLHSLQTTSTLIISN